MFNPLNRQKLGYISMNDIFISLYCFSYDLTLFGTGGDTFIPLTFLDHILSTDFFSKNSKLFWR